MSILVIGILLSLQIEFLFCAMPLIRIIVGFSFRVLDESPIELPLSAEVHIAEN